MNDILMCLYNDFRYLFPPYTYIDIIQ